MSFKDILSKLDQLSEADVSHKGTYGTSYGKEDVRDQYGHRVGKVDKGAETKKEAPKRGRGRPKKGADDSGEVKTYDSSALSKAMGGGQAPKKSKELEKLPKTKHSLKEYFDRIDEMMAQQPIPVVGKQGDTQSTGAGFLNIDDSSPAGQAIKDAIGKLAQQKKAQIVMPTGTQQKTTTATTQKPTATSGGATNQPAMAEEDYSAKKARAGKDIGKPGKQFAKIAKKAGEKYGSEEKGKKVAGAILAKLRGLKEADLPPQDGLMGAGLGAGRNQGVAEESSNNKYSNLSNRGVNRGINRAADDFNRMMDLDQAESPHYKTQHQQDTKQRLKTKQMAGPKGPLPEEQGMAENDLSSPTLHWSPKLKNREDPEEKRTKLEPATGKYRVTSAGPEGAKYVKQQIKSRQQSGGIAGPKGQLPKQGVSEGAKPDFPDIDDDGNTKEPISKAAQDAKKDKKKVKEGMEHRLKAAHHRGKAHALAKESYNSKYDDMEEARMYHEGYKEGLDECYGQIPIRGQVVGEEGNTVDDMASFGAHTPTMEADIDEMTKTQYMKQQAIKTPGGTFKAFGQTMHDKDVLETDSMFESWDNQLGSLLDEYQEIQEGLSVSVSKGQQGAPDSVTVSAQDADADKLLQLVKHAGLGLFGDEMQADVGAPTGADQHVGLDVVGDHDGMMALMKKMSGGEPAGTLEPSDGEDYKDEKDHEEGHDDGGLGIIKKLAMGGAGDDEHKHANEEKCNECGGAMEEGHSCGNKEMVDEVESEDQMEYEVAEDNAPDSGAEEFAAMDQEIAQDNAAASSHGGAQNSNLEEEDSEEVEEEEEIDESYANSDDDKFQTDIDFMTKIISGGLNKQKSTGQTTIPVIAGQDDRMGYSVNESLNDWKKLAGM